MDSMGLTLGSVFVPPPEDVDEDATDTGTVTGTGTDAGTDGDGDGGGGGLAADLASKLDGLRGEVFNDHLRYLCVYDTFVDRFDTSLNRFRRLTTLDLSGNRIATLHGNLDLPQVRSVFQLFQYSARKHQYRRYSQALTPTSVPPPSCTC